MFCSNRVFWRNSPPPSSRFLSLLSSPLRMCKSHTCLTHVFVRLFYVFTILFHKRNVWKWYNYSHDGWENVLVLLRDFPVVYIENNRCLIKWAFRVKNTCSLEHSYSIADSRKINRSCRLFFTFEYSCISDWVIH